MRDFVAAWSKVMKNRSAGSGFSGSRSLFFFRHEPHIALAGLDCSRCHGKVKEMDRLGRVKLSRWDFVSRATGAWAPTRLLARMPPMKEGHSGPVSRG